MAYPVSVAASAPLPPPAPCQLSRAASPLAQGTTVQAPGLGPILSTALRGVNAVSAKLTDIALQASPCTLRCAPVGRMH